MSDLSERETLSDVISLLLSNRSSAYRYEREIRLFTFLSWVEAPDRDIQIAAELLAATRFLLVIANGQKERPGKTGSTERLQSLLSDQTYSNVFDATIGSRGGWAHLARVPRYEDLDKWHVGNQKQVEVADALIDFRFRYMEHEGRYKQLANILHSQVFWWKKKKGDDGYSASTVRNAWNARRDSALFSYVRNQNDKFRASLATPNIGPSGFTKTLKRKVKDREILKEYFGTCAYVAEKLTGTGADQTDLTSVFPASEKLERKQPVTATLARSEIALLDDYKVDVLEFKSK